MDAVLSVNLNQFIDFIGNHFKICMTCTILNVTHFCDAFETLMFA